jgi:protein-tyrosine phosphatase
MKATIYSIESALPNRLAIVARPRGGDWLCDELRAVSESGIDVLVSMLTPEEAQELGLATEAEECGKAGLAFVNIPIVDRSVPGNKQDFLDRTDGVVALLRNGRSIGIHCRASIGRSSMLAVSVLVRLGWAVDRAFQAVETARRCSIPDTLDQKHWLVENIRPAGP